ncbi:MAG: BREX system ATP-binding domain-containing protein [Myxococcota bacterium]
MSFVGARVEHPVLGEGVVLRVVEGGRRWSVVFDARPRVPYRLSPRDLRAPAPPPPLRPLPTPDVAAVPRARQCLEALRMGVVPAWGLDRLTVGRDTELASIEALLAARSGMRVLCGGYGTGKTHLVEVAEARARASHWLVARASFDAVEVPPSHPIRLYRELAASLSYPDDPRRGLLPLLDRLLDSRAHLPGGSRAHGWLTPALWARAHVEDASLLEDTVAWAAGEAVWMEELRRGLARAGLDGAPMLALPDYRTFGQLMAHLLGGIAAWAKDAGYAGLLVLLDEAEYLDRLGAASQEMAQNVLKFLAVGAMPRASLAFDPEKVYRGGHDVHRRVPTRFAEDQPLAVLCAFTPHPGIERVLGGISRTPEWWLPLEPVRRGRLGDLADRVLEIAREVYPALDPRPEDREALRRALLTAWDGGQVENTRDAARMAVEYWDLYRASRERAARALR